MRETNMTNQPQITLKKYFRYIFLNFILFVKKIKKSIKSLLI